MLCRPQTEKFVECLPCECLKRQGKGKKFQTQRHGGSRGLGFKLYPENHVCSVGMEDVLLGECVCMAERIIVF